MLLLTDGDLYGYAYDPSEGDFILEDRISYFCCLVGVCAVVAAVSAALGACNCPFFIS